MNLVKEGQIFVVNGKHNHGGHNYTAGRKYRAIKSDTGSGTQGIDIENGFTGNMITVINYDVVNLTKKEFENDIANLEKEIAFKKSIIAWMNETGNEEYNNTEHMVWTCVSTLSSDAPMPEKVKAITNVIENCR